MLNYNKIELSILNQTEENTKKVLKSKNIKNIHIDVMDGYFVKNMSNITPFFLKNFDFKNYKLHLHFMVEDVEIYYNYFDFLDNIKYVSFHVESNFYKNKNIVNFLTKLKEKNIKVGLAINPDTGVDLLSNISTEGFSPLDFILEYIDFFLIMTVIPGLGGQKFISHMEDKIKYFKKKFNKEIIIDGGVNEEIYYKLENTVDKFIMGSYLYK